MPASLATVGAITKEIYEGSLRKQLNDETVGLRRLERSSDGIVSEVGGKYVTFPLHVRRNAGIGARNEMEALPIPGQQGTTAARVGLKYLYGGVRISGQTFELAEKNYQAFTSAVDLEMDGLKNDLAKDQNRQFYGTGTGTVATVTTGSAANVLTFGSAMYVQLGMQVDVIDGTTLGNASPTIKAANRQVTAVDTTTNQATIDGAAVTAAVGDIIVRTGSVKREWTGLQSIVQDTGTLYNVDPTVEPTWKAVVDANGGVNRALSEGLMILMADKIRANGGRVTAIFSNLGVRRAYFNLLVQQRRYTNTQTFEGGFSGLAFTTDTGDIPFVVDLDCPRNSQFFINEKELTWYRDADWSFMNRDGSMWQRVIGYDAYEAYMYQYSEIGTHRRNTHGVIRDITEG